MAVATSVLVAVPVISFTVLDGPAESGTVTDVVLQGVDDAAVSTAPEGLVVAPEAEREAAHEAGVEADVVPTDRPPAVLTGEVPTDEFTAVAFTWDADAGAEGVVVQVRVREGAGWTEWYPLPENLDGPDPGTVSAARAGERAGTALLLTSGADAMQVRADAATGAAPADLRAVLIDPEMQAFSTPSQTAGAAVQPGFISRAQWGAGATPTGACAPTYSSKLKAAVVHHTVSTNTYTPQQSAGMVKSMWLYHTTPKTQGGNGWCDIGYNVLVDRHGQIFEGAAGGLDRNVIGAHAGGFNEYTFGVSTIGDFQAGGAPGAMVEAVSQTIAWKFDLAGILPTSTTQLTSKGGGTSKYPAGTVVTLPVIMGHRDVGSTACPGQNLYAEIGAIRNRVYQLVGDVGSTVVRTPENGSVYVVSGMTKYPVPDMATLSALSPLGKLGFVSQQYLDRRTTGARMGRVVLSPNGSVYFIDSGIKLPFSSCELVADYGASGCGSQVRLEQPLIDAFEAGPSITSLYQTTSNKSFYVVDGTKREVVDTVAQAQAQLTPVPVQLQESGLANLPLGVPVTRDGVVLRNRQTAAVTVSSGGEFTTVSEGVRAASVLASWPVRDLDDASLQQLPTSTALGALVKEPGGPRVFLLTEQGKTLVTDPAMLPASVPEATASLLGVFPEAGTLDAGTFVKGSANSSVYVLRAGQRRGVSSMPDLVALSGGDSTPPILRIDQQVADLLPLGPAQLGPGALVVSPASPTVWFVDGLAELIPVSSFSVTGELGATRLVKVANADVDAYTKRSTVLTTAIDCAGTKYLGLAGKLYTVGTDVAAHYPPLTYTSVDQRSCAALVKSGALTRFLLAPNGTVYYIEAGQKRAFTSYGAYQAAGGTTANTLRASTFALSLIPTGPDWSPPPAAGRPAPESVDPTTPETGPAVPAPEDGSQSGPADGSEPVTPAAPPEEAAEPTP